MMIIMIIIMIIIILKYDLCFEYKLIAFEYWVLILTSELTATVASKVSNQFKQFIVLVEP